MLEIVRLWILGLAAAKETAMVEDIRGKARRTLEEIFPNPDAVALGDVVHARLRHHELPPGMPQRVEGMKQTML